MPTTTNPATGAQLHTYEEHTPEVIETKLSVAQKTYESWSRLSIVERSEYMKRLADVLRRDRDELAHRVSLEMGKPITAARAEIEKCAACCDYYAVETERILAPEVVKTDGSESFVSFEPIGIVLAVMPWNYPFWQVIRFIAPAAMAGNVGVLKHASNVPQSAELLEAIFDRAGFPKGVFQNLLIGSSRVEGIIQDPRVKAVTLTGSEYAGSQVAMQAGKALKKTVLELGGSDPFIVLADADIDATVKNAVTGRFQNSGQSCIAAKRFIVEDAVYDEFLEKFRLGVEALVIGDPLDEGTQMWPLATTKIRDEIAAQVASSVKAGARLVTGGILPEKSGAWYSPTILAEVKKGMSVYDEETFGPVAAVIRVSSAQEAIRVANDTSFGLGASLHTTDLERAKALIPQIHAGSVFINSFVKSDSRLPFGGIGRSGYGRELAGYGMKEFVNVKSVYVK